MKKRPIILLSGTAVLLILMMIANTVSLRTILKEKTDLYVQEVSGQSASYLSDHLHANLRYIGQLADTIDRMPPLPDMSDFLQRKADAFQLDLLAIVDQEGNVTKNDFSSNCFDAWLAQGKIDYETPQILNLDGRALLFSVPMPREAENRKVLAGILEQRSMQQILSGLNFHGEGIACVVDPDGNVIVAPVDNSPFLQFLDLVQNPGSEHMAASLSQMIQNVHSKTAGIFDFSTASRERLLLSYHPLSLNDWLLIAIVRQDLITGDVQSYALRSFALVGGVFAVFALFLALIISGYEKNRRRLEAITLADPLTGGDSNCAFQRKLRALVSGQPPSTYTLLFLNIKGFQVINETYGVLAGDRILRHVHRILSQHLQEGELACRSEMDHFFLCLKTGTPGQTAARLRQITADLNDFSRHVDIPYNLVLKAGGYRIDDPLLEVRAMQDHARSACITELKDGACTFFDREMLERIKREALLESLFESSLANRDFQVYLQPKVRPADGKLRGAEALVRWHHPEHGVIYPSDFIPLFERNGNICALDLYIFEEVCKWLRADLDRRREPLPVSVNLSRTHIKNLNFLRRFVEIKQAYRIPDGLLEFELTESILLGDEQIRLTKHVIRQMHRHGFLCSLDDFGFGYSSLALLKEFEIDVIKLDKCFFDDMQTPKALRIIEGFINISHSLDIRVVAEGIETREQLECLRDLGCDLIQGYYFSRPLSLPDFEAWRNARA